MCVLRKRIAGVPCGTSTIRSRTFAFVFVDDVAIEPTFVNISKSARATSRGYATRCAGHAPCCSDRQGWIPLRQPSRLIVRTARFSAEWISRATVIASRSRATEDFPSTRAGCVSRDGPQPKRSGIQIACCLRSCGTPRAHSNPSSWQSAIDRIASAIQETQAAHGRDAVGVFGGGSLTNEKAYLLGKFARVALGTSNVDYNGRFCMSSAAAGATKALGLDRGLPFPLEDIPHAEAILLVGGNMAETMPPVMRYFEAQQRNGGALIVADPRRSPTAQWATLHLALRPGSDAALANGLVHLLIRDSLIDRSYIDSRTEGFDDLKQLAAAYWPERVEALTGVPQRQLVEAARILGQARTSMVLTARGAEQQSRRGRQRPRLHQHRARPRESGAAVQRLRDDHRPGKRAGWTRARAEGRPAAGLPPHRRSPRASRCRCGLGHTGA